MTPFNSTISDNILLSDQNNRILRKGLCLYTVLIPCYIVTPYNSVVSLGHYVLLIVSVSICVCILYAVAPPHYDFIIGELKIILWPYIYIF